MGQHAHPLQSPLQVVPERGGDCIDSQSEP